MVYSFHGHSVCCIRTIATRSCFAGESGVTCFLIYFLFLCFPCVMFPSLPFLPSLLIRGTMCIVVSTGILYMVFTTMATCLFWETESGVPFFNIFFSVRNVYFILFP